MANTQNGVTIDVTARIKGYESDLEKYKKAIENINPGTSAGKALSKMLKDFESGISSISKNSEVTLFSDRQIDSFFKRLENIDKISLSIGQNLSNIQVGDMNFAKIEGEMGDVLAKIGSARAQLQGLQNLSLGGLVKDLPNLVDVLTQLGINLDTATFKEAGKALGTGFAQASKEVEKYTASLEQSQAKLNEITSKKNDLYLNSPRYASIDEKEFKDLLTNSRNYLFDNAKIDEGKASGLLDQFKANLTSALESMAKDGKIDESLQTAVTQIQAKFEEAFSTKDFNPSTFVEKIKEAFAMISDTKGLTKTQVLGEGFNKNTSAQQILNSFFSPGNLAEMKAKAQAMLTDVAQSLEPDKVFKLSENLKDNNIEKFFDNLVKMVTQKRDEYIKALQELNKEEEATLKKRDTSFQGLAVANNAKSEIGAAKNEYGGLLETLQNKITQLEQKIAELEAQRNAAAEGAKNKVNEAGKEGAGKAKTQLDVAADSAKKYHNELNRVSAAERGLGSIQNLIGRWFSVYGAINMVRRAIKSMISDITQLDKTINKISIVTNFSMDELWQQVPQYTAMAQKYGVAISGVYEVSQLYYQQGLKTAEVTELTASTLELAKISGLDYSTATNYMTNAVRSFKMEMSEANTVTDAYAALAASSASSVQELATAMSKTASSAQAVGMTMQETSAMMAVMIEATREAPENIGSAMKSIISRYGEMTSDPAKLVDSEGQEMSLNKVDKALQTVGISLHDSEGQFRSFTEVITELAGKWDSLSSNTQRYIATVMAGNRQQSRFLALVSSGERLATLTDTANNSQGAGQLQTLKSMDTIETKAQQAKTALQEIYNTQGIQNLIKGWYDFEASIGKAYARMVQVGKLNFAANIIFQFVTIGTALTSLFKVIKTTVTMIAKRGQIEDTLTTQQEVLKRIQLYEAEGKSEEAAKLRASQVFQNAEKAKTSFFGVKANGKRTGWAWGTGTKGAIGRMGTMVLGAGLSLAGSAVSAAAANMEEKTQEQRDAKANKTIAGGVLSGAGTGISMGAMLGPWGALTGALIGGIAGFITKTFNAQEIRNESTQEKLNRLKEDYETKSNKALESKSEVDELRSLKAQYDQLYKARNTSNEAMREYQELCNSIASSHSELISGYDSEGNAIVNMGTAYERLYEIKRKQMLQDQQEALLARYNYNSDINAIGERYGLTTLNVTGFGDRNGLGIEGGGSFSYIGAGERFRDEALGRGYQAAMLSLGREENRGQVLAAFMSNQLTYQGSHADDAYVFGNVSQDPWSSRQRAHEVSQAMARAYTGEGSSRDLFYFDDNGQRYYNSNATRDWGEKFLARFQGQAISTVVSTINAELDAAGLDSTYHTTEDAVRNMFALAEMADSINVADQRRQEFSNTIKDFAQVVFADDTEHMGIEIALYRDLITQEAQRRVDEDEELDTVWTELTAAMINDNDEYGITAILGSTGLANMTQRRKERLTEIYDNIAQYNEAEFDALVETLHLDEDDPILRLLNDRRQEVTADYKRRFRDLITTDLRYTSGTEVETDRNGIEIGEEVQALSNTDIERWAGIYNEATETWSGGFFSPEQLDKIGSQFEDIINNTEISDRTRSSMVVGVRELYNSIIDSVDNRLITESQSREISNLIANTDLTTFEGIYRLAEQLNTQYGISLTDADGIGASLNSLLNAIQVNLFTEINTYINTIADKVKEFSSAMKKGFEGMSFDEAISMASALGVAFDSSNFDFKNGKFYLTDINLMVGHYVDSIKELRDRTLEELRENSDNIHRSANRVRQILGSTGEDNRFNTQYGNLRLGDILLREEGYITEDRTWRDVFTDYGIYEGDNVQLAQQLQLHQNLYDQFTDQNESFSQWIQDNNKVWAAWAESAATGSAESIQQLRALTGLSSGDAEQLSQELQTAWSQWISKSQDDRDRYGNIFLAFAREAIDQLEESYDFSDSTFNYLVAQQAISQDGIEAWWDYNTVIQEWVESHTGVADIAKTRIIQDLRNNNWADIEQLYENGGITEEVYQELVRYGDLFYQNYTNLLKNGFTAMAASITEGAQSISVNNINKHLLIGRATNVAGEIITEDTIDNYTSVILDLSESTIEGLNSFLNEVSDTVALTGKTRIDTISAIQKAIGERSLKNVASKIVSTYESFTYDVASALGQLVHQTVEQLEESGALIYDAILGTYSITPEKLIEVLASAGYNLTPELQAQLDEHTYSLSMESAINNIIKNYNNVSATILGHFAELAGTDYTAMIERFSIGQNADGTYRIQLTRLRDLVMLGRRHLTEAEYENINQALISLYDSMISEITNIPNTMKSGFTKTDDMQKYVDMINQSGLFGVEYTMISGANALFEWNDVLHAYTYSTQGLLAQIQYFYRNLNTMSEDQQAATQQLLRENVRTLAGNIDILSYLSSGRTAEDWAATGEAYDTYVEYVRTLDAEIELRNAQIEQAAAAASERNIRRHERAASWAQAQGIFPTKDWIRENVYQESVQEILDEQRELITTVGEHTEDGQRMVYSSEGLKALIDAGGATALDIVSEIYEAAGKTLTSADAKTVYRAQISRYTDTVSKELTAGVHDIVDQATYDLLRGINGYTFDADLAREGVYLITSIGDNLYEVYNAYLDTLRRTNEATLKELNDAAVNVLINSTDWGNGEQAAIDLLSRGASVTYAELSEFFTQMGWEFSEEAMNALRTAGIIERQGGNKVAITDWRALAEIAGIDYNSPEYVSGLSAYNDAIISMNQNVTEQVTDEVEKLSSATRGDRINLTYFANRFNELMDWHNYIDFDQMQDIWEQSGDEAASAVTEPINWLAYELSQYGATLENGILTLGDNADIYNIIRIIQQRGQESGALAADQVAELQDALVSMVSNFVDAVKKGISGTLTYLDVANLQELMSNFGINMELNFTTTAEGLQLSTRSAMLLYNELRKVNAIAGEAVFKEMVSNLQSSNSELQTMAGVYNQIHRLTEQSSRAEGERKEILETELNIYRQMASYMQLNQPDSYKLFDSGDAYSGVQGFTNFISQFGTLRKTIADAGTNGYMEWTDFESWARGMTQMAQSVGHDIVSCGITFDAAGQAYADLMQHASIQFTTEGQTIVDINNLGPQLNFNSAAALAQGRENNSAIQEYANQQVEMLDSIIKVLEIIVAMEKLGDLDINGDQTLNFDEIFSFNIGSDGVTRTVTGYANNVEQTIDAIKQAIDADEELKANLQTFFIGENSLYDIIAAASRSPQELIDMVGDADTAAALLNWLYNANLLNYDDMSEAMAQLAASFNEDAHLGTLSLHYTLDDVEYYIDSSGARIRINEEALQEAAEQIAAASHGQRTVADAQRLLIRAWSRSGEELLSEGDIESAIYAFANSSSSGVRRNGAQYEIQFGDETIRWTPGQSTAEFGRAMAAEQYLKNLGANRSLSDIQWNNGEPFVTHMEGTLRTEIHLNAENNGVEYQVDFGPLFGGRQTGATLEQATQRAYEQWRSHAPTTIQASAPENYQYNVWWQHTVFGEDYEVSNEFTSSTIRNIEGLRDQIFEAWNASGRGDFRDSPIYELLTGTYGFNLEGIENWDQLANLLDFEEREIVVNGHFNDEDTEIITTLLTGDREELTSTLYVQVDDTQMRTINGNEVPVEIRTVAVNNEGQEVPIDDPSATHYVQTVTYNVKVDGVDQEMVYEISRINAQTGVKEITLQYTESLPEGTLTTTEMVERLTGRANNNGTFAYGFIYSETHQVRSIVSSTYTAGDQALLTRMVNDEEIEGATITTTVKTIDEQQREITIEEVDVYGTDDAGQLITSPDDAHQEIQYKLRVESYLDEEENKHILSMTKIAEDGSLYCEITFGQNGEGVSTIDALNTLYNGGDGVTVNVTYHDVNSLPAIRNVRANVTSRLSGADSAAIRNLMNYTGEPDDIESNHILVTTSTVNEQGEEITTITGGFIRDEDGSYRLANEGEEVQAYYSISFKSEGWEPGTEISEDAIIGITKTDSEGNILLEVKYSDDRSQLYIYTLLQDRDGVDIPVNYVMHVEEDRTVPINDLLDYLINPEDHPDIIRNLGISGADRAALSNLAEIISHGGGTINITAAVVPQTNSLIDALNNLRLAIERRTGGGEDSGNGGEDSGNNSSAGHVTAEQRGYILAQEAQGWLGQFARTTGELSGANLAEFISIFESDLDVATQVLSDMLNLQPGQRFSYHGLTVVNYAGELVSGQEAERRAAAQAAAIQAANGQAADEAREAMDREAQLRADTARARAERERAEAEQARQSEYEAAIPDIGITADELTDILNLGGYSDREVLQELQTNSRTRDIRFRGVTWTQYNGQWMTSEVKAATQAAEAAAEATRIAGTVELYTSRAMQTMFGDSFNADADEDTFTDQYGHVYTRSGNRNNWETEALTAARTALMESIADESFWHDASNMEELVAWFSREYKYNLNDTTMSALGLEIYDGQLIPTTVANQRRAITRNPDSTEERYIYNERQELIATAVKNLLDDWMIIPTDTSGLSGLSYEINADATSVTFDTSFGSATYNILEQLLSVTEEGVDAIGEGAGATARDADANGQDSIQIVITDAPTSGLVTTTNVTGSENRGQNLEFNTTRGANVRTVRRVNAGTIVGTAPTTSVPTSLYLIDNAAPQDAPNIGIAVPETTITNVMNILNNPYRAGDSDFWAGARDYSRGLQIYTVENGNINSDSGHIWSQGSPNIPGIPDYTPRISDAGYNARVIYINGASPRPSQDIKNQIPNNGDTLREQQLEHLAQLFVQGGLIEFRDNRFRRASRSLDPDEFAREAWPEAFADGRQAANRRLYDTSINGFSSTSRTLLAHSFQSYVDFLATTSPSIANPYQEAVRRVGNVAVEGHTSRLGYITELLAGDDFNIDIIRDYIDRLRDGAILSDDTIQALFAAVLEGSQSGQIAQRRSIDQMRQIRDALYGEDSGMQYSSYIGLARTFQAYDRAMTQVTNLTTTRYRQLEMIDENNHLVTGDADYDQAFARVDISSLRSAIESGNFSNVGQILTEAGLTLDQAARVLDAAAENLDLENVTIEFRDNTAETQLLHIAQRIGNIYNTDDLITLGAHSAESAIAMLQERGDKLNLGSGYIYDAATGKIYSSNIDDSFEGATWTDQSGTRYGEVVSGEDATSVVTSALRSVFENTTFEHQVNVSPDTIPITIHVVIQGDAEGDGSGSATLYVTTGDTDTGEAGANAALAGGRGTLMGELGPELVVSNGRYFTVGNNGAEFVNLDDDAIVFNHLQTRNLLRNGHSSHGKPVTNERKAISFAKGNALSNASSALSTLKALRSMWQNLAEQGLSEFAQQAGGGGGGGGAENAGYIADLERWYTLLREIDRLEKDITHQETLRKKLESDRVIDGEAYYRSQKESLKLLEEEVAKTHELAILQKSYYDARRADLEASPFGQILKFDEHGHMIYNDEYTLPDGMKGGLAALAELNAQNADSSAKYTAEEQYNILKGWGFEEFLKYDTSGKEIDVSKDEGYSSAVQAFWDKIQGWKDELDDLYDGFKESQDKELEYESQRNEILQKIIDNQISLENRIEKAIEDSRQREIDEAKSQKDAIQKSTESFIKGLSDSLEKERKMYENSQSDNELNRLRRQLAILQRSGGSASQIRSLQQDITSREQDQYFNAQQDQIDAIQKASEAEMERLDHQIQIMTDTLEYEKQHGLLWNEVKDIMTWTPEEIESFLLENSKDLEGKSTLQIAEDLRTIKSEIEQWIGYRDDENNPIDSESSHNWNSYYAAAQSAYSLNETTDANIIAAAKAAYEEEYARSGDESKAAEAADEILYKQFGDRPGAHAVALNTGHGTPSSGGGGSSGGSGNRTGQIQFRVYRNAVLTEYGRSISKPVGEYTVTTADASAAMNSLPNSSELHVTGWNPRTVTVSADTPAIVNVYCSSRTNGNFRVVVTDPDGAHITRSFDDKRAALDYLQQMHTLGYTGSITGFSSGGLAKYTGLAMVHGTPQDPEAFLNAEETHMWRDRILGGNSGSLTSMLIDFQNMVSGLVNSDEYATIGGSNGINIENATVNMNATISNDYDARRAADTVMEEMVRIARKTTAQQARR